MKFEAKKAPFFDALQMALNAIPNKTTLQILNNFLFRLEGNTLEITSTDLDLTIDLKLEVKGLKDGGIVVHAKKFLEVVRELPDLPVHVSVEDYVVTLKSETGFHCNLTGFDASEYPSLPDEDRSEPVELPVSRLKDLFEKTSFAVSTDFTSRLALTGVYLDHGEGNLIMVGTDGHRLGKSWVENSSPEGRTNLTKGIILPPRAIHQVLKMVGGSEDTVRLEVGEATVKFYNDSVTIFSKLIEGPYPNYSKVIPTDLNKTIIANREELINVLKRVATMAHTKTRQVKFSFEKNNLFLSAKNLDLGGESEESMPVEYSGKAIHVGFNGVYVLEVLRLIHTENVCIQLNSSLGATLFKPHPGEAEYFFIVMPLRLLDED